MLFSVLIPVYNVEKYLKQCLGSLLNQTFNDFEVIMVNDGSKDTSGEICNEYAEKDCRFKVIHQENSGVVKARQTAISHAVGDYIVVVDSDDFIGETLLSDINDAINHYNLPDVIVFDHTKYNNGVYYKKKDNTFEYGFYEEEKLKCVVEKLLYNAEEPGVNTGTIGWTLWGKAIKRKLLMSYQLSVPSCIRMGEDVAVVVPLFSNITSLAYINSYDYYYRIISTSLTNTYNKNEIIGLSNVAVFLKDKMPQTYNNNINVYSYFMVKYLAFKISNNATSLSQLKTELSKLKDSKLFLFATKSKFGKIGFKEKLKKQVLLFKYNSFLLWLLKKL